MGTSSVLFKSLPEAPPDTPLPERRAGRRSIVRDRVFYRILVLALVVGWLASCSSVSSSGGHAYLLGDTELQLSARAEHGATGDHLVVSVNGVDVAEGPFGPAQAAGTTLRGRLDDLSVEAHCGHRWRPGIHIGYRCVVSVGPGAPIELDF